MVTVFWTATPSGLLNIYQSFGAMRCFHFQVHSLVPSWLLTNYLWLWCRTVILLKRIPKVCNFYCRHQRYNLNKTPTRCTLFLKILKILFALFRSTCFGHPCVHHKEVLSCTCSLWSRVVLGSLCPPVQQDWRTTNQAPHGTRDCMCSWEPPDDGHKGGRNM